MAYLEGVWQAVRNDAPVHPTHRQVEYRGHPHEQRLSRRLPSCTSVCRSSLDCTAISIVLTNRRIRVRTYGGVGGGSREASSRPIPWLRVTARDHSF